MTAEWCRCWLQELVMNDFQIKPCKPVLGSKRTGVSEVSGFQNGSVNGKVFHEEDLFV